MLAALLTLLLVGATAITPTIYLIDTGVAPAPDVYRVDQPILLFEGPKLDDCSTHGTEMLQQLRRYAPPGTHFVSIRVANNKCELEFYAIDAAYQYIASNFTQPAFISLSFMHAQNYLSPVLARLIQQGAYVFAAAGNDGTEACDWPAMQDGVYAVTASAGNSGLQRVSDTCVNKTRNYVLQAPACWTSHATALAAGWNALQYTIWANGNMNAPFVVTSPPDGFSGDCYNERRWQWPFMGAMIGGLVFVIAGIGGYCYYRRRQRNENPVSPV